MTILKLPVGPRIVTLILATGLLWAGCSTDNRIHVTVEKEDTILLIGNNLCSNMMEYNEFETELYLNFPDHRLTVRNLCDPGNTAGFRPHSGRSAPWAFPYADTLFDELSRDSDSEGFFRTPDQWLNVFDPDLTLAFFGYPESWDGQAGLQRFRKELTGYVRHFALLTGGPEYGSTLVLVSPTSAGRAPGEMVDFDADRVNENLRSYVEIMEEVARVHGVPLVNVFDPSLAWHDQNAPLTVDGYQLNALGYQRLGQYLVKTLFNGSTSDRPDRARLKRAVAEKSWFWHNDYKIPNGVHVFGRRFEPFGPDNYPAERAKLRQMTRVRDSAIWALCEGYPINVDSLDALTLELPDVTTNFEIAGDAPRYLYGQEAIASFIMAPGFDIQLFASEREFPDLANPVQLAFDDAGRLWVAVMPTYPHWKPGDPRPNDKLLILEDVDGDGTADRQTVFADNLHLPIGFEFAPGGVFVSQLPHLKFYADTNGDNTADVVEIVYSGFDDHDTHHAISAFCADPSGAIYMGEGIFLHTNVETPYGVVRATNGGFFRFEPGTRRLERTAQLLIPNPWGIAFDRWGQNFFAETSNPNFVWMLPGSVRPRYGVFSPNSRSLIEDRHRVRPTSGVEFVSSRHFPETMQGDLLINNTIGYLGTKQHTMTDDGTGYASRFRQDLLQSSDPNFRPVDLEFAPDGSLYIVDWHNVLVGHMQHNARDPLRDHVHGRIYRVTYSERPLLESTDLLAASIPELLDELRTPEYRQRYRARRVLRGRNPDEVESAVRTWYDGLNRDEPAFEQFGVEALWVGWGIQRLDHDLLNEVLQSPDFHARAAAVRVVRYMWREIANYHEILREAAQDEHGRVRLEAIVAASWLSAEKGLDILSVAAQHPLDDWMKEPFEAALAHLNNEPYEPNAEEEALPEHLQGTALASFIKGKEVYLRDAHCASCHQRNGNGLIASGYPTLQQTPWVTGNKERLIKIALHGVYGPMEVAGTEFVGQVPMTPFKGLLDDQEVADVLTYVRNAFGNRASPVEAAEVAAVRNHTADRSGYYTAEELLRESPLEQ